MGKMMARWPLKWQFILTFVLILFLSAAATAITAILYYYLFSTLQFSSIYPANHYEKQIPALETSIRKEGTALLDAGRFAKLADAIPAEGIRYQVVDREGRFLYGTEQRDIMENGDQLSKSINTTFGRDGDYTRVVPLFGDDGYLGGAVLLTYKLTPTYASQTDKMLFAPMYLFVLLSPFVYIALFTFLFARRLANNMGRPLRQLIQAAKMIKEKDLNFTIDYKASNELGQLSEAFRDMKAELETSLMSQWRMEQERLDMMENLAHDIKTPLAVIRGYADALLMEQGQTESKEKWQKYISIIKENAMRGSHFVEHMQIPANSQLSAFAIRYARTDLEEWLKGKTENYKLLASRKEIGLSLAIRSESNASALSKGWIDVGKAERILDNIVLNAIRHTPANGVIEIKAALRKHGCAISVCDSGEGFDHEDLPYLFNKHYRGAHQQSGEEEGRSGRGLYIAKQLAEMHGGTITACNGEQGGACVEFELAYGAPDPADR